jgi:hypothetical protein
MTPTKNPNVEKEAKSVNFAFPAPDDWKNIAHDLKLTKIQENELEITIRHVIANIVRYQAAERKALPRDTLVAALKRLEKALGRVQYEMERGRDLTNHFLPSNTLEFIGKSFTFTAIGQAVGKDVFPIDADYTIQSMYENNEGSSPGSERRSSLVRKRRVKQAPTFGGLEAIELRRGISLKGLENRFCNDRVALGYKNGGKILKHFIDFIHADLKSWVEADRRNEGGRPANIFRKYIIQRLAKRSPFIIGKRATTTSGGRFSELCIGVLPACGFSSRGIEKAIAAVLEEMKGKVVKKVKRKAKSK